MGEGVLSHMAGTMDYRTLNSIDSLEALEALISSEEWGAYLEALNTGDGTVEEIESLRAAVAQARTRLSPEEQDAELRALKAAVYENPTAEPADLRPILARIAARREALPTEAHARLFGRLENRIGHMFAWATGGSGYSNRARRASSLFTEFAGQTFIAGADTDQHGNALGTGYDLGRDGAFEGFSVHVLQLYSFGFSQVDAAFRRKGFDVSLRKSPGDVEDFTAWLADATQLWLISDSRIALSAGHIEAIRAFWARGGALYVWGDNQPFYADANAVISALIGKDLVMKGDTPGGKVVNEHDGSAGFLPHLVTTGLVHLFEGITVASLREDAAERHGFAPLLYGSAGNLITISRDATEEGGPIIIDTAFTRLYCQWDEAGSARYVCNAGCFLAAGTSAASAQPAPEAEEADAGPLLEVAGAWEGVCDLSGEPGRSWMVLSVGQLADALRNTSDMILNDPLRAGADNCVFSDAVYSASMGQWLLNQSPERRADPISGEPVVACLPLVDLSHRKNLRVFTDILCVTLMDGKRLPAAAQQIFFAVVDEMLQRESLTHIGVWAYLYRQCLDNFQTTPTFSAVGEKVSLLEAMSALMSPATDPKLKLRRSFESVGLITRTLVREERITAESAQTLARQARINVVVRCALAAEKARPGSVPVALNRALYDNFHGVPRLNGGRVVSADLGFVRDVSRAESRLAQVLGAPLLSDAERTAVLHAMMGYDLRQFSAEALVTKMRADSEAFRAVWDGEGVEDIQQTLNARFAAYADALDWSDPHISAAVPFVTTAGPSVYRCVCGETFGDPGQELDEQALAALQAARRAHFRAVYRVRSKADTWYPCDGSLHYNLHRAVQTVIREQFPDATRRSAEMLPAVAAYLLKDGKGFIFDPLLEKNASAVIDSYLSCRRDGQPHAAGLLTLEVKARAEQALLIARQAS